MNIWLITDTHFNHDNIATYCDRPVDFTERIIKRWQEVVKPEDTILHLGDVAIGNRRKVDDILAALPGRKILVRGNHDRQHSNNWWMEHGFAFACDGLKFHDCWLSHEPALSLPLDCKLNIHGHLHNIWHGFKPDGIQPHARLYNSWQRLLAIEYTEYRPVQFQKFVDHPKKYLATGLGPNSFVAM